MNSRRALCVITARGGSKRIPRKNIKDFLGKPIIAYSIEAAIESKLFDEVMVSTDDEEIARISQNYGADVPFLRSRVTSDDYATTADVLIEVLNEYSSRGRAFDIICCLYPTAPFVRVSELKEGMALISEGASSVIPVTSFDFSPLRGFKVNSKQELSYAFPEYASTRSQDLPEMVHDCGRFYIARIAEFVRSRSFITPDTKALRIPRKYVQDIDTLEDWELAEAKFRVMIREEDR